MGELDRKSGAEGEAASSSSGAGSVGKSTLVQRRYGAIQRKRGGDGDAAAEGPASGGGGSAMPEPVASKMSQSFGIDLSGVRMHEGGEAASMGAQAYAQGSDVHFAPGQYQPETQAGQELIGHELAHVVQQSQGRVQSNTQAKGMAVNDDPALEHEADVAGARAARGEPAGIGGFGGGGGGPVQMKREPITPAGESFLSYLKQHYRTMRRDLKKSRKDDSIATAKQQATALDLTKEKNEDFIALVKIFKVGLHGSDLEQVRTQVEGKFTALGVEIAAEAQEQVTAETQETKEGGHAIDRHGPAVSDDSLKRRLFTGIAPDDEMVPAPGTSSRFNSYTDMNECRQRASTALNVELTAAAGHVVNWLASVPGLANTHVLAQQDVTAKTLAFNTAKQDKINAFATNAPDKLVKLGTFQQSEKDKKGAEATEKTAKDENDNPGKNLKRILPGLTKVKFKIKDDAGPGELEDSVQLDASYGITIDNGKPIGSGFEAAEDQAIKLSTILPSVVVDANASPLVPKSKSDITSAVTGAGVVSNVSDLVDWLLDPANLDGVKKKGEKGAKVYKTATATGALTKSYTNFKTGTTKIFDGADAPVPINTTGWDAIQHFPANNAAALGMD